MNINQKIIKQILEIKSENEKELSKLPSEITLGGSNPIDIDNMVKHSEIGNKNSREIKILLKKFEIDEIKNVYVFYYYGRSFTDGSMSTTTSFDDLLNFYKDVIIDDIIEKLSGTQYYNLKNCWEIANKNFVEHEKNAPKEKEIFNKRLSSYTKNGKDTFFKFQKKENKESTNQVFINIFNDLNLKGTTDINTAKNIINSIIDETNNNVVVDFLGSENFDNLNYVENDDEILKLY